jgi:hypothetical protein
MITAKQSALNFHHQTKLDPVLEALALDQRNDSDLDESLHIEDILKEEKMREIIHSGDYQKHYGFDFDRLESMLVQRIVDAGGQLGKHKGSIERMDLQKLPRGQSILTNHYLERSCNFLNKVHI